MFSKVNIIILIFAGLAAFAGFWLGKHWHTNSTLTVITPTTSLTTGELIEPFVVTNLNNQPQWIKPQQDKWLLINYWATWCTPCLQEMPILDQFYQSNKARLDVVGIALDDTLAVKEFLNSTPVQYNITTEIANSNDSSTRLGNRQAVLPYTVLVNPQGQIIKQYTGVLNHEILTSWLELLSQQYD